MLHYTVVENTVVKYNKNREEYYTIPMYSTNAIEIKFILDDSWKEYVITAQISNGEKTYNLLLQNNTAFIPADITAGIWNVSIFGVKGEEKRNTTIPSDFCVVEEGFKSDGQPPIPPEPDLYQKLLSEIQKGIEIAQSVKNDADAGKFDGEDGNGIERIELVNKVGKVTTYKIIFTNGEEFEYQIADGADGKNGVDGVGIKKIELVEKVEKTARYKITLTDGNYFEYEVLDGENGKNGITPEITVNATVNNSTGIPNVSVEKTGTTENPIFNLSFENLKGEKGENGQNGTDGSNGTNGVDGKSATITIGKVTTVSPDTPASVTNSGTETDAVFDFEIPKGADGSGGDTDLDTLEKIAIKTTIEGNPAMSGSSTEWRVPLIEGYGKSTQEADPTPEAPQDIKDSVVTGIRITDGAEQEQLFLLSAPITLRGVPSDNGNITIDGQKYLSDYIGQKDGVYGVFRKTQEIVENGTANWFLYSSYSGFYCEILKSPQSKAPGICNQLSVTVQSYEKNSVWLGLANKFIYTLNNSFYNPEIPDSGLVNWKAHLAENPLKIITVADEETFEPLPEPDQQALKDLKTFYPTSIINWETEDGAGAWTRAGIIHDPTNYIEEKISSANAAMQSQILVLNKAILEV